MKQTIFKTRLRNSLIIVSAFNLLNALVVGSIVAWNNSRHIANHMPAFNAFFWLGLTLLVIVGATHLLAVTTLARRRRLATFWSAIAGFSMQIWALSYVYVAMNREWPQIMYFALGTLELILVLGMVGLAPKAAKSGSRSVAR